ncbi:MAG: RagB/SusD family nutrient uptake outer membrane protein [Mediterranea sp.]|jgi:hypothetical protein|nr:RagB/SusD family nutrient uptake outer membrane protein [Mediterranea sp.]
MRNKFLYSIGMLVLLIAAGACTDLEMQSDGRDTLSSIFANYGKARSYYQSITSAVPQTGNSLYYNEQLASYSDEAQDVTDISSTMVAYWYAGNVSAISNPMTMTFDPWYEYFVTIRRCNTFLQAIDDPEMTTFMINDTEKNGWKGQVHVVRAFAYLQLMKRYGAVPVMDTPNEVNYDYSQSVRNSVEEVTDFILADCDAALALPEAEGQPAAFRWALTNSDRMVISRAFAQAVKSEAALYAASPLFYESGSKYTWEKAAQITREALQACLDHGFELYNTPVQPAVAQNPYAYYFIQQSDPSRQLDKETIYESTYQLRIWQNNGTPVWDGATSAGSCPSQELVDAYETTDGEPVLDLDRPYLDANHLQPNYNPANTLYNPNDPYANRDPRFYASIYYNGSPRKLAGDVTGSSSVVWDFNYSSGLTSSVNDDGSVTISLTNVEADLESDYFDVVQGNGLNLVFEYKSNKAISDVAIYGAGVEADRVSIPKADDWTTISFDVQTLRDAGLGSSSIWFGIKFYSQDAPGYEITTRNVRFEYAIPSVSDMFVDTYVGGNCEISSADLRYTRTGYYLRKYNNHRSNVDVAADGYMKLYRLAGLYLNFAEAAYNAAGPDASVQGLSAREAVNRIRTRAGMPELPAGMSKDAFEKRYRNERRVEMAFEEQRFFDVRRWKILGETDGFVTGMKITKDGEDSFTYERVKLNPRNCSNEKFLLFPISWTEVTKMNALTGTEWQNPGWE